MPNSKKYTFFENDFILEFKEEHLVPQGYSTQFQQTGQNEGKKLYKTNTSGSWH